MAGSEERFTSFGDGGAVPVPDTDLAHLPLGEEHAYKAPVWPIPEGDGGLVWLHDERYDATTQISGLFQLAGTDLRPVPRYEGIAIQGHWERHDAAASHWSPELLFPSLAAALVWGRSVAPTVKLRLGVTEPPGTFVDREGEPLPAELIEEWDRRYAR